MANSHISGSKSSFQRAWKNTHGFVSQTELMEVRITSSSLQPHRPWTIGGSLDADAEPAGDNGWLEALLC